MEKHDKIHVCIGIETLDDVVFETDDSAVDDLQTKHHTNTHASFVIGNRSANFIGGIYEHYRQRISNSIGGFQSRDNESARTRAETKSTGGSHGENIQNAQRRISKSG